MTQPRIPQTLVLLMSSLDQDDRDETVAIYRGLTPRRKSEVMRKLRRAKSFRTALRSRIPSASVSAHFIDLGKKRTSQRLWVTASADPGKAHPFSVDEAINKAASETGLDGDFFVMGTGGGCGGWQRDVDFWEGTAGR